MAVKNKTDDEEVQSAQRAIAMHYTWNGMNGRCNNPFDRAYKNYGARGIVVEWENYEQFFRDMYKTYSPGLTLDRIDNDGNYSPLNCRWATAKEQANNTRKNRQITLDGITKTTTQWCEELGLRVGTVNQRINHYGWTFEEAFTTPVGTRKKGVCMRGHPFDESTKRKDNKGHHCKVCRKINQKERV